MTKHAHSVSPETIWTSLRAEAQLIKAKEPALAAFVQSSILAEKSFLPSLARILSAKLASAEVPAKALHETFTAIYKSAAGLEQAAQHDLIATRQNDPAAHDFITPFLFFKGFQALQSHRLAHNLWRQDRRHLALHLQSRISEHFGVDIHPAAVVGHGVMMDHATGIVIGETAVVENDVLFWHGVTLGGVSLEVGDRHPKIRQGVHLGAGSTMLGPVEIGAGARVAAGSVVLENVPAGVTVAGVPARVVSKK
jgi:serine O-acetyltransferase